MKNGNSSSLLGDKLLFFLAIDQSELGKGALLAITQFLDFSCRKVMKRGHLYFLFSFLAHWCSYLTESQLQSIGKMLVFRSPKMK